MSATRVVAITGPIPYSFLQRPAARIRLGDPAELTFGLGELLVEARDPPQQPRDLGRGVRVEPQRPQPAPRGQLAHDPAPPRRRLERDHTRGPRARQPTPPAPRATPRSAAHSSRRSRSRRRLLEHVLADIERRTQHHDHLPDRRRRQPEASRTSRTPAPYDIHLAGRDRRESRNVTIGGERAAIDPPSSWEARQRSSSLGAGAPDRPPSRTTRR
jgi:hypothetical protein